MTKLKKITFYFSICIIVWGCLNTEKHNSKKAVKEVKNNEINDSLALKLAIAIEEAAYFGDSEAYFELMDFDRFSEMATNSEYQKANENRYKKGFITGMKAGIKNLAEKINTVADNGGFYDYISHFYSEEDRNYRILFRMYHEEEGLNYHEYILEKNDSIMLFKDMYVYMSGEKLSETMNKFYLGSLPQNILEKIINGNDGPNIRNLVSAFEHNKKGQHTMAIASLDKITGKLRHEKIYHLIKVLSASNLEDYVYREVLSEMANDLEDDPTASLLFVDHYIFQEEYDKAIAALDKVQNKTQDDFIDYIKGNVAYQKKDYQKALIYFNNTKENYPEYYNATFSMISVNSLLGNYDNCIALYNELLKDEIYSGEELIVYTEEVDEYGYNELDGLVKSKAFKKWKSKYK